MNIQAINSQNFGAKKFRLPVKSAIIGHPDTRIAKRKVNWVKEYENPNAAALYKQAQNTKNLEEKLRLLNEMGKYRVIDLDQEKFFAKTFKKMQKFLKKLEK